MKKETAEIAAKIVDRANNLEKIILKLQELSNCTSFKIIGEKKIPMEIHDVLLTEYSIEKEIFSQDILEYFINTLNLELEEELKKLEEL